MDWENLRALAEWVRQRADGVAVALLILAILALHGHGLTLGFWLDDHNHLELCRKNGYQNLATGNQFDWTGRLARVWWAQKETGWAYFRPLTVAVRTTLYELFGLNPVPYHVVQLGLYAFAVLLLYALVRRCGGTAGLAGMIGFLFTLNPTHVFAAPWLANDGSILVGVWTFLAIILMDRSLAAGHRDLGRLAGVAGCLLLATLSRESGIMLAPMLVLFDIVRAWAQPPDARPAWVTRLSVYGLLAIVVVTYLWLRSAYLPIAPAPRSPYFHWPTEPGFFRWLAYKLLNDALCLPLGLPFVPIVGVPWLQARPLATVLAAVLLVGVFAAFVLPLRKSPVLWGVLAATGLAVAPTILVFSAPYHYYLPAAGWAVVLGLWVWKFWPSRPRLVGCAAGALVVWYLVGWWGNVWCLRATAVAEASVREEVLAGNPHAYPAGTHLFFINLPFFGAESGPALRLATDREDLTVCPLTLAPEVFVSRTQVGLIQEDDYTLRFCARGEPWFAGSFGDLVQLGWFGARRCDFVEGPVSLHPAAGSLPFSIEVVRADRRGIWELRFVFEQPLKDPHYRFFVGLPWRSALPLRFPLPDDDLPDEGSVDPIQFSRLKRMQMAFERVTWLLNCWTW
jgi:hypothetical protein